MFENFSKQYQQAEVTIKIGDYIITMQGEMQPPVKNDKYNDKIRLEELRIPDITTTIDMSLRHPRNIQVEQWRWIIPVSTPPRIEK